MNVSYVLSAAHCVRQSLCTSNGCLVGLVLSVPTHDGKVFILVLRCTVVFAQVCYLVFGVGHSTPELLEPFL